MPELVIIRGLPGSGKSTLARTEYPKHAHWEADMYFVTPDGDYEWKASEAQKAHSWCLRMTKDSLESGIDVVVSNTFTRRWEMQPYLDLGFPTKIVVAEGDFPNIHDVPETTMARMRERWEP